MDAFYYHRCQEPDVAQQHTEHLSREMIEVDAARRFVYDGVLEAQFIMGSRGVILPPSTRLSLYVSVSVCGVRPLGSASRAPCTTPLLHQQHSDSTLRAFLVQSQLVCMFQK